MLPTRRLTSARGPAPYDRAVRSSCLPIRYNVLLTTAAGLLAYIQQDNMQVNHDTPGCDESVVCHNTIALSPAVTHALVINLYVQGLVVSCVDVGIANLRLSCAVAAVLVHLCTLGLDGFASASNLKAIGLHAAAHRAST